MGQDHNDMRAALIALEDAAVLFVENHKRERAGLRVPLNPVPPGLRHASSAEWDAMQREIRHTNALDDRWEDALTDSGPHTPPRREMRRTLGGGSGAPLAVSACTDRFGCAGRIWK